MKVQFECKEIHAERTRNDELPDGVRECFTCNRYVSESDHLDDECVDCMTQFYYDNAEELVSALAFDYLRYPQVKRAYDRVLALYRKGEA